MNWENCFKNATRVCIVKINIYFTQTTILKHQINEKQTTGISKN